MRRRSESRSWKAFLLGLCSGVVVVVKWRPLLKTGIKAGMRGASEVQRAAVRGMENVADVTHEVRSEMAGQDGNGARRPPASPAPAGARATATAPANGDAAT